MRYYIHIPLPEKLREVVRAVEEEYQGKSGSDPHITIIPPREIIEGRTEQELVKAIKLATKDSIMTKIIERRVGYFRNSAGDVQTVYIGIYKTPALSWLHDELARGISGILEPPTSDFADFKVPHITLATKLSPKRGLEAWVALRDESFFTSFWGNTFILLRKDVDDERWQEVRSFKID